jgi:hypothetical protein
MMKTLSLRLVVMFMALGLPLLSSAQNHQRYRCMTLVPAVALVLE